MVQQQSRALCKWHWARPEELWGLKGWVVPAYSKPRDYVLYHRSLTACHLKLRKCECYCHRGDLRRHFTLEMFGFESNGFEIMKGNPNDDISQANSGRPGGKPQNNYLQNCDPGAMTVVGHCKEDSLWREQKYRQSCGIISLESKSQLDPHGMWARGWEMLQ